MGIREFENLRNKNFKSYSTKYDFSALQNNFFL